MATITVPFDLMASGTSAAISLSTVGVVVVTADVDVVADSLAASATGGKDGNEQQRGEAREDADLPGHVHLSPPVRRPEHTPATPAMVFRTGEAVSRAAAQAFCDFTYSI